MVFKIILIPVALLFFSCTSTPIPKNGPHTIPEDFFGMVHAGETGTVEEYTLLDEMGVKWLLLTFYWSRIESQRGVFNFSRYDAFVDTAKQNNMKVVAVLAYQAHWLYPEGNSKRYIAPENISLFLNYVEKTVGHFHGRVDAWEIWNEPNNFSWKGSRKEFIELTRVTALKIKETEPESYVIGGAFWRAPGSYIKNMHRAGALENLDGLAFHPYALNPSAVMKVHDSFNKTLSEIGYKGEVWITEMGYPTGGINPIRVSHDNFPSWVVKNISGAAVRGPRVLIWYELYDTYNKGEVRSRKWDSEQLFGLVYPDNERKDAAWAYELCARYLPGSGYAPDFLQREGMPQNIISYCFLGGVTGNNTLIIWNDNRRIFKARLFLPAQALDHDISTGQHTLLPPEIVLEIGKQPLFFTWKGEGIPYMLPYQ